jgi:hypothetical protein
VLDGHRGRGWGIAAKKDGHREHGADAPVQMAIGRGRLRGSPMMSVVCEEVGVTEYARDEFPVDGLELPAGREFEGIGGDAVGVA